MLHQYIKNAFFFPGLKLVWSLLVNESNQLLFSPIWALGRQSNIFLLWIWRPGGEVNKVNTPSKA